VRFALIVFVVAVAAVIGLFLYGQFLEPDTRVIEQEALRASDV